MPDAPPRRICSICKRRASLLDEQDYQPSSGGSGGLPGEPGPRVVAAAIRGEAEALRLVWQANRRWIAAVLLAHKPREADLEDLLQEVAVAYVRMVSKLRDEAMLKPWLRTVAINTARAAGRDASRRRGGMPWMRGSDLAETRGGEGADWMRGEESLDEQAGRREDAGRLVQLAAQLPDGYREPLLLKAVQGMSYREIGRVMGLPETTVETRVARGRRMLRELAIGKQKVRQGGNT
jgi:RNA polymerase sigma-70 factor, ECF subfamily